MLGKPRILSLFPNSFNKLKIKHEYSCNFLYLTFMVKLKSAKKVVKCRFNLLSILADP